MMPHPERACSEALGNTDGRAILRALLIHAAEASVSRKAGLVNI
jgi:phosphoribosylformylglycinamidine synthase